VIAAGLEIVRDDAAVRLASPAVFAPCSCGTSVDATVSLSRSYSMVSSAYVEGAISDFTLEICPRELDTSDDYESWVDAWDLDVGDAEELFRFLSRENPLEEDPSSFADLLRRTGLADLGEVADDLERLEEGESLDEDDDAR
jgi:hypothetical protein